MPRSCTVCGHDDLAAINRALVDGDGLRDIAGQYRVSKSALDRHRAEHLPAALSKAKEAEDVAAGTDLLAELRIVAQRVHLLSDACDAWLRDADDPTRYDIGPRSEEVWVTYLEADSEGKLKRQKKRLNELLDQVSGRIGITMVETKYADPRELVLKCYDRLQGMLELIAKLIGQIDERPVINLTLSPEWHRVRSTLMVALLAFPEARVSVAEQLQALEAGA